jgi:hypothetical protein
MWRCDLFGLQTGRYLKAQDFPLPFVMKNLSRVGLSCRNPLMTGELLVYLSSLIYPSRHGLTLGNVHINFMFLCGTLLGLYFEQMEVEKALGRDAYADFCRMVPNVIFPNIAVFFKSDKEIKQIRSKVYEASGYFEQKLE